MDGAELIVRYRRFLKRKNYSVHTVKNYLNILGQFSLWLKLPIEEVTHKEIGAYMEHLLRKRQEPKTITCHLGSIRAFYDCLHDEEGLQLISPVKKTYRLRLPPPQNTSKTSRSRHSLKRSKMQEIRPYSCSCSDAGCVLKKLHD